MSHKGLAWAKQDQSDAFAFAASLSIKLACSVKQAPMDSPRKYASRKRIHARFLRCASEQSVTNWKQHFKSSSSGFNELLLATKSLLVMSMGILHSRGNDRSHPLSMLRKLSLRSAQHGEPIHHLGVAAGICFQLLNASDHRSLEPNSTP